MTYEKPVFYGSYRFDLDKNPLTKTQNEFLESKDSKGYNKSQYEITFRNKLDESLRTITWIFNYCHKLKKSDIYEIFNAKSMEYFVNSLLKNIRDHSTTTNTYMILEHLNWQDCFSSF